jgi:hypothetical protein
LIVGLSGGDPSPTAGGQVVFAAQENTSVPPARLRLYYCGAPMPAGASIMMRGVVSKGV